MTITVTTTSESTIEQLNLRANALEQTYCNHCSRSYDECREDCGVGKAIDDLDTRVGIILAARRESIDL